MILRKIKSTRKRSMSINQINQIVQSLCHFLGERYISTTINQKMQKFKKSKKQLTMQIKMQNSRLRSLSKNYFATKSHKRKLATQPHFRWFRVAIVLATFNLAQRSPTLASTAQHLRLLRITLVQSFPTKSWRKLISHCSWFILCLWTLILEPPQYLQAVSLPYAA